MNIKICGTGSALPEKVMTNKDLEKLVDTEDSWIVERTGISQRHMVSEDESAATLGAMAAKNALLMSGYTLDDIDLILVAACKVQALLGTSRIPAFDVNSACTGFLTALTIADAYFNAGIYKRILIIGTETLSKCISGITSLAGLKGVYSTKAAVTSFGISIKTGPGLPDFAISNARRIVFASSSGL